MNDKVYEMIDKATHNEISQEEAFEIFDSLEPISYESIKGVWKGQELLTGHFMEGLLSLVPWFGKEFADYDSVTPLLFEDKKGNKYTVNPKMCFWVIKYKFIMKFVDFLKQKSIDKHIFNVFFKAIKTDKYCASMREVNYRGKVSMSMIYDELAIIDSFRKVDENTLFCTMDLKGNPMSEGKNYFFILRRM